MGRRPANCLLLLTQFLAANTASRPHELGKRIALKQPRDNEQLRENVSMFSQIDFSKEEIKAAGEAALSILYGGKFTDNLDSYWHQVFQQKVATSTTFDHPQDLHPTSAAAKIHCLRTYLQVQNWIGLQSPALDSENWDGNPRRACCALSSWTFQRHQRKFSQSWIVAVKNPVIVTGTAVIEMASNATLLANLAKELVALMLKS